jgi:hypothetical protein
MEEDFEREYARLRPLLPHDIDRIYGSHASRLACHGVEGLVRAVDHRDGASGISKRQVQFLVGLLAVTWAWGECDVRVKSRLAPAVGGWV